MYNVTCDGFPLLDWRDNDLILTSPRVKLEVNTVGEGSFTIYKTHPHYDKLKKLKSVFEVSDENSVIFRGRATGDTVDFDHGMAVDLEGAMAFFNDSVVRPFHLPDDFAENADYNAAAESGNVIEFFLGWLIDNHNSQVQDFQKMKVGNVTVSDPNNYITRSSSDYASTWATLKDKLFDSSLGGYLCIRYESDGNYIDYLADFEEVNAQEIAFGENILDLKKATEASGTYSAIIPIGALGLTIEGVEDGDITEDLVKSGDTIYSKSAVAEYGWIYAPTSETTWDDVTEERNLIKKGGEWLANGGVLLSQGIEVTGVDLHFSDAQIESLRIYKKVNVQSAPHNLTEQFSLTKLEIELLEPQNTKISIGKTIVPLSERTIKQEEEVRKKYSKLSKNDEEIKMEVQDFGSKLGQTLRIGADGVTITNAAGETLTIDGGQIDATKIKAQDLDATKIKAGDLVLTGTLSWSDFTDNEAATALKLDANGLVCTGAGGQVTISGGQIDATSLQVNAANITGTLTASQIDATGLKVDAANITGTLTIGSLPDSVASKSDIPTNTNQLTNGAGFVTSNNVTTITNDLISTADLSADQIVTGELSADRIKLHGNMAIYKNDSSDTVVGYIGYSTGLTGTNGVHMGYNYGEVMVTGTSAKIAYNLTEKQVYVSANHAGISSDGMYYKFTGSAFYTEGNATLGTSTYKWGQGYSAASTFSTSDRNEKNSIEDLPVKYLDLFDRLRPVRFKFNDGTSGRFHVGFIAQDVEESMTAAAIDSQEFGGFGKDIHEETGEDIYMLRYEEFVGILAAKLQEVDKRVKTLEGTA